MPALHFIFEKDTKARQGRFLYVPGVLYVRQDCELSIRPKKDALECTSRLVGSVRRADPTCRAACAWASAWTR